MIISEGEADWKMIAIAITDPWAAILNDVTDLEAKLPGNTIMSLNFILNTSLYFIFLFFQPVNSCLSF